MKVKAVLFDFDGVLVDGENHHIAAWQRTLAPLGITVAEPFAASAAALDDREFLRRCFADRDITDYDGETWLARKQDLTRQLFRDSPPFYPGAVELIEHLKGRVRLAVVSTTWRANVEVALQARGLLTAFEQIVGKEDVHRLKPHPEPYLTAKRLLQLDSAIVAIEDSASGITSARAAGLKVLAVGHRQPQGEWTADTPFIPALTPIEPVLAAIGI